LCIAALIQNDAGLARFLTSPFPPKGKLTRAEVDRVISFFDPCVNEEISGLAHGLSVPPEQITDYAFSYSFADVPGAAPAGACSHMAVRPTISADGHTYLARSYEWSTIATRLSAASPSVTRQTMKGILSDPVPAGVCCYYYAEGMGTLWSMIFDATAGEAEVAFGSPALNPWRTFGLHDPVGVTRYAARFPDEVRTDPDFFKSAK
jgi:hypothetical protein